MNQASQQSNSLINLIDELKTVWHLNTDNNQDQKAKALINAYIADIDSVSTEEFDIQKKVLAKTREKTEELLAQIEALEVNK